MKKCVLCSIALLSTAVLCCTTAGSSAGGPQRPVLDSACVPVSLRDLVPLAAEWGCADTKARDAMERQMTHAQRVSIRDTLVARVPEIRAWLGSAARRGDCAGATAAFGGLLDLYEDISDMSLMKGLR
jgi:hypothetical protein